MGHPDWVTIIWDCVSSRTGVKMKCTYCVLVGTQHRLDQLIHMSRKSQVLAIAPFILIVRGQTCDHDRDVDFASELCCILDTLVLIKKFVPSNSPSKGQSRADTTGEIFVHLKNLKLKNLSFGHFNVVEPLHGKAIEAGS
jgi:hypothetical protein